MTIKSKQHAMDTMSNNDETYKKAAMREGDTGITVRGGAPPL